jgi:hypothetical protein
MVHQVVRVLVVTEATEHQATVVLVQPDKALPEVTVTTLQDLVEVVVAVLPPKAPTVVWSDHSELAVTVEQALAPTRRGPVQLVQALAVLTLAVVEQEAHTHLVQVGLVVELLVLLHKQLTTQLLTQAVAVVDSIHQAVATLAVAMVDLEL